MSSFLFILRAVEHMFERPGADFVKKITFKKPIDILRKIIIIISVKGIEKGNSEMVNSLLEIPLTKHKKT